MPISNSIKWRRFMAHRTLALNLSSILLHHNNPLSLLRSKLNLLPLPFPSSLLRRVLFLTRSNPQISLRFFLFASSHLSFAPTILDLSTIFSILSASGHTFPAARIFSSSLRTHPVSTIFHSVIRSSSSCNISHSKVLSFVMEIYSKFDSWNSMEIFKRMREFGLVPTSPGLNALLDMLCLKGEIQMAWLFFAAALRAGSEMDCGSWKVLVRLFCGEGKVNRAEMLINLGFSCRLSSYDLVLDCYARRGDFVAAIQVWNGMEERGLRMGLSTLSSLLEESFRFGNVKIFGIIMKEIIVRGLLPMAPKVDFDQIIRSFCDLGKTSVAVLFFDKARSWNFDLESNSYECLVRALCQNGRGNYAIKVFDIMSQQRISMNPGTLDVFFSGICNANPSEKIDEVIKNLMENGFLPPKGSNLSIYIAENCSKRRWKQATEMLNLALEKGIYVDGSCCCLLMKHFCKYESLDMAIDLHEKMKGLGGFLDVNSYNVLLEALVRDRRRTIEAIGIFECMRKKNVLSSFSYVIMISALCREKELRKAMELHDEMLKLGHKPDFATYKRLITGFL